jgi:hypothetical protein
MVFSELLSSIFFIVANKGNISTNFNKARVKNTADAVEIISAHK